jgi:hypothetical protein
MGLRILHLMPDPTLLGIVDSVTGATVTVMLDRETVPGVSFVEGYGYRVGQVGSFVRIPLGYSDLFGIVTSIGAAASPGAPTVPPQDRRWLTVQLVGEGTRQGDFTRGVSQFPTVGDGVHLVSEFDLTRIYGRPADGKYLPVGRIASADPIPALIDVNKLVTRHSAVVGSTGAGKSTTVATLLSILSEKARYPSARVLLLDVHGEYARAFRGRASVFRVTPDQTAGEKDFRTPYWALNFDELLELTLGRLEDVERGFVRQTIEEMKRATMLSQNPQGVTEDTLTVDTPIPFSIHKLWFDLHRLVYATYTAAGTAQTEQTTAYEVDAAGHPVEKGDPLRVIAPRYRSQTQAAGAEKIYLAATSPNIRRPVDGLGSRLRDKRYDFLFRPGPWTPDLDGKVTKDLDSLVEEWLGGPEPVAILDLSGIPVAVLSHLVGALLRIVYDCLFWARNLPEGGRERPLLIVLEEAHIYLSEKAGGRASEAARRLVKEGRKYGLGAMIVSQRPSEIDPTILSQCGTLFAMRLTNASDRNHVTSAVVDNLEGLLGILPSLRTGETIIIGEAVHLPMRALIDLPPPGRRPDSQDPKVYTGDDEPGGWNSPRTPADYAEVVTLWRKQDFRSQRAVKASNEEDKTK